MKVTYHIPINEAVDDGSVTVHALTIEGSRKKRKREFGKYVKRAYNVRNPRALARAMGFKDLL